ncbi:MAG: outer membrane beta-barrel protein [Cytophagales bacterium]|nr:PorT family protein [Bernardetiaceae bacterium]MDW8205399.1 outer membrane beta-barrel protein [Cytophagales bacterium]
MKSNGKEWEDIFREAFENAELMPSEKVWERIEREVTKKPHVVVLPKLKQLGIAAAIMLFALSTSYVVYRSFFNNPPSVAIEKTVTNPPVTLQPESEKAGMQPQADPAFTPNPQTSSQPAGNGTRPPVHSIAVTDSKSPKGFVAGASQQNREQQPFPHVQLAENSHTSVAFLPLTKLQPLHTEAPIQHSQIKILPLTVPAHEELAKPEELAASRRGWIGLIVAHNRFSPGFSQVSNAQPTPFIRGQYADASVVYNDLTDSLFNKSSVSLQIDGSYFVSRKWAIRSGLTLMRNAYSINSSAELILPPFLQGSAAKANSIDVNMQMLSLPLQIAYVSEGKFGYQISAGIASDFTLSHHINSSQVEGVQYSFGDYKRFNISGLAGIGIFYNLTPQVGIHLDATYRRSLTSVYQTPHLRANPQWISLGGGLLYKF